VACGYHEGEEKMNKRVTLIGVVSLGVSSLFAVELHKANNTTELNQAGSWTENATPTANDTLVWDATVTAGAATNVNVGAGGISVAGLRVENPGGTIVTSDGAGVTSMVGLAGIALTGTANLYLNNLVQTSNDVAQVWSVATGRLLSFGQVVGLGSGSVSLTGAGSLSFFADVEDRTGTSGALTVNWNGPVGTVGTTATRKNMILTNRGSGERTVNMQSGALTVNSANDNYGLAIGMKNKETWNISGGTVSVDSGGAFHVGGAGNYATATGEGIVTISGTGKLVANGTLPLYMARPSTGAIATKGTINLDGGSLETARTIQKVVGSSGNTAAFHFNGGLLKATGAANWFQNLNTLDVKEGGARVEVVAGAQALILQSLTHGGVEPIDGGLVKSGAGTLGVNNAFTGKINVQAGVLGLENVPSGDVTVAAGAGLTFKNTANLAVALTDSSGKYTINPSSLVGLYCLTNTTNPSLAGVNLDGRGFVKMGSGALTVTSAALFTGATSGVTLAGGALNYSVANAVPAGVPVTVANGGMLTLNYSSSMTLLNPMTLSGNFDTGDGAGSVYIAWNGGTANFNAPITLAGDTKIKTFSTGSAIVFNQPIGGAGNLVVAGGGADVTHIHTVTFNAANTFMGDVTLKSDAGANARFNWGINNAMPASSVLMLGGPSWNNTYAMIDFKGYNQSVKGLADAAVTGSIRSFTNSASTASLLTLNDSANQSYSGALGGRIDLIKGGAGTQSLLGNGQGHTGTVAVTAGALTIAVNSLPNADVIVSNGARLQPNAAGTFNVRRTTITGTGADLRGALYFGGANCTWNGEVAVSGVGRVGAYSGNVLEKITGPVTGTGELNIWAGGGAVTHPNVYELSGQSTWKGTLSLEASFGAHLTVKLMSGDNRLPEDVAVYFNPTWEPAGTARVFSRLDLVGSNQRAGRIYTRTGDHLDHCRAVINSTAATTSTLTLSPAGGLAAYYEGVIGASGPCTSAGAINVVKEGDGVQVFRKGTIWNWIDSTPGTNIVNADVTINAGAIGFSGTDMLAAGRTVTVGAGGALIAPDKATLAALTNDVRFVLAPASAVGLYDTWDVTAADPNRLFYYSGNATPATDNTAAFPNGVAFAGGVINIARDGILGDTVLGPTTAPVYLNGTTLKNNDNNPILSASRTLTLNASGAAFTAGWGKNLTLNSKVTGVGPFNVNCDSGKIILSNPLNDYAGHTTLGVNWAGAYSTSATLQLGASEVIPHGEGKGNLIFDAYATGGAKLDLNGFNERVNGLLATLASATVTNTSATLSTFTLSGSEAGCTYAGRFGGAMKIVKEGTNTTQTLTGLVAHTGATRYRFAPYKNSGETCVKAGTLIVADSARFQTPGAVVAVEGGATLRVESDAPFGGAISTVMLYAVATSAAPTLNIPSGTTLTVRHFYLGGYFRKAGTYGAPGSGADYEVASLFTGGGLLNVLEQGPQEGTTIFLR
jgi:autotransporter-associated beta strand protein